ncbi:hypothetical protein [aff. Roholtiella sp. LEGE 12411]|uniref:hypothetical protein n=1 Tax=aff. Roholtiella sp. LEGE 12411 TaxID=1828822 RepID=UPI00187FBE66|nr:hypothetical protein [aff. Roholtiella sp. LEGE 12411]MBE9038235.1 hypothetical protein [aff. Roholtiella sp. LEGE 12411]
MKRVLALAAIFSIYTTQALAMPARVIYSQDIDSMGIELKVSKGYGLTLDFMATGETIKQVWIGDPSRFAFTSNGNLCSKGDDQNCEGGKATVLFIRQIKPIAFPNMTSSGDGSTQITILTNQKQYQFKLIATGGQPSYTSLVIKPESEKPQPLPRNIPLSPALNGTPQLTTVSRTAKPVGTSLQRNDANALAYGLLIAKHKGQIRQSSPKWNQIQTAIALLRQGKSRADSARISGTTISVIEQLIKWGQI